MKIQKKIEKIFKYIHQVSSSRFVVRASLLHSFNEDFISAKAKIMTETRVKLFKEYKNSFDVIFKITYTESIFKDQINSVLSSNVPIEIFYDKNKNIAVVFDHALGDARSAISFVDTLFSDNDVSNKQKISLEGHDYPAKYKGMGGVVKTIFSAIRHLSIEFFEGKTLHPDSYNQNGSFSDVNILDKAFSKEQTEILIKFSRENNISLSALFAASQLSATKNICFRKQQQTLGICIAADLRDSKEIKLNYKVLSVFVSGITLVQKISQQSTLLGLANELNYKISKKIRRGEHYSLMRLFPHYLLLSKSTVTATQKQNQKCSLLTNAGAVESFSEFGGETNLNGINFWTPPNAEQSFSICLTSHGGKIIFNMVSYVDRFNNETAKMIHDEICNILDEISLES